MLDGGVDNGGGQGAGEGHQLQVKVDLAPTRFEERATSEHMMRESLKSPCALNGGVDNSGGRGAGHPNINPEHSVALNCSCLH